MVRGWVFFLSLGALVPMKGNISATTKKAILNNCMVPTWLQYG